MADTEDDGHVVRCGCSHHKLSCKKIFSDSELQEDSVIRKFRITAADGKSYSIKHYSLEMIIAVGFKVNSERAVQFRKWINQIAKDYTIKGWVIDMIKELCNKKNVKRFGTCQTDRSDFTELW